MAIVKNLIILHHWGEEHLEKLPESLIVDLRQNKMWASGGAVLGKIDIVEAWDIANDFELPRVNNINDEATMKTTIIN